MIGSEQTHAEEALWMAGDMRQAYNPIGAVAYLVAMRDIMFNYGTSRQEIDNLFHAAEVNKMIMQAELETL